MQQHLFHKFKIVRNDIWLYVRGPMTELDFLNSAHIRETPMSFSRLNNKISPLYDKSDAIYVHYDQVSSRSGIVMLIFSGFLTVCSPSCFVHVILIALYRDCGHTLYIYNFKRIFRHKCESTNTSNISVACAYWCCYCQNIVIYLVDKSWLVG